MAAVNELITKFGFKTSITPLVRMNATLGATVKGIGIVSGAALAASAAMSKLVLSTTAGLDSMVQLSRVSGVSVSNIQALGFAASVSGSNLGAVQSTIDSLTNRIGSAAWKGDENFARLGITVRKSNGELKKADQILMEVQDRFQTMGLSMQEKVAFAGQLGIDKSLVQMMSKSGKEMDTLMSKARKLGTLTKADADAAVALNDSMAMLKFGLSAVQNQLAVGLAPHMQKFSDMVVEILGEKKGLISKGVGRAVEVFVSFGKAIKDLLPVIGVLAAIGAVIALIFSPTAALIAGISLALVVIQDLMVAFRGGKSVIRDFVKETYGIDIVPGMKRMYEWAKKVSEFFKVIIEGIKSVSGYKFEASINSIKSDIAQSEGTGWYSTLNKFLRTGMVGFENKNTGALDRSTKTINQTNYFSGNASSGDTADKVLDMMSDAIDQANRGGK